MGVPSGYVVVDVAAVVVVVVFLVVVCVPVQYDPKLSLTSLAIAAVAVSSVFPTQNFRWAFRP